MTRKRRKARKLGERYGAIVTLLGREDLETLLNGRAPSPQQPARFACRRRA